MSFESLMTQGYPAVAEIDDFLSDLNIELITEDNPDFITELKQHIWGILNAVKFSLALSVYCPSSTTFNVRGGDYLFDGVVKTYAPGSAVNPTDSDTTYVWLTAANAVGSGIDGSGWPAGDHIKLAELDVDADGVITAVRDLRGKRFLHKEDSIYLLSATSVDLNAVASTTLYTVPAGKKFIVDHIKPRNLSASAAAVVATFGQSGAKTDFLAAQNWTNLNAAGKSCKFQPVPSATPAAIVEYAAGTVFVIDVTTAAGSACTATFEVYGRLADA